MIKKIILAVGIFLFSTILINGEITLKSLNGFVQYKTGENNEWITPTAGETLQPGYIIYTGFNSTAILQTNDSTIEVKALTQMSISALQASSEKVTTDIYLKYGKIKAEVNTTKETQTLFKVRSANSTASVRGTMFNFGDDNLFVERGTVYLLSDSGFSALVQFRESAQAGSNGLIITPLANKKFFSHVNTRPIGLSNTESGASDFGFKDKSNGQAKVIIRIKVIK